MSISIILYISVVVLTIILFLSYIAIEKAKSFLKTTTDEMIEQIQIQQQTKIDDLEKKLESYYVSIKLNKLCIFLE